MSHLIASLAINTTLRQASTAALQLKLADQINKVMSDLGDQEFGNAIQSVRDALTSRQPRHELTSAINHLQSAASNFQSQISREYGKTTNWLGQGGPNYFSITNAREKRMQCYAIIAAIYAGLGERKLARQYGRSFADAAAEYLRSHYDTAAYVSAKLLVDKLSLAPSGEFAELESSYSQDDQGVAYSELGLYQSALQCFEKAVREDPGSAWNHYHRAEVLYDLKRYTAALQASDKAIKLDPDSGSFHNMRGISLLALHRYREAVRSLEEAHALKPGDAAIEENLNSARRHVR